MIGVSKYTFVVIGGESFAKPWQKKSSKGLNTRQVLRDIWVFNINESQWFQIEPKNGPFPALNSSAFTFSQNVVYIFGGLNEKGELSNELYQISFAEDEILRS